MDLELKFQLLDNLHQASSPTQLVSSGALQVTFAIWVLERPYSALPATTESTLVEKAGLIVLSAQRDSTALSTVWMQTLVQVMLAPISTAQQVPTVPKEATILHPALPVPIVLLLMVAPWSLARFVPKAHTALALEWIIWPT